MPDTPNRPFAPSTTLAMITACRNHLAGLIGPDGRFVYAHPLDRPDCPLSGYNELRHCGTLWFMLRATGELGDSLPTDATRIAAMGRAVGRSLGLLRHADWMGEDRLALVSDGAIKLGAVGLALCMVSAFAPLARRHGLFTPEQATAFAVITAALQSYALDQIAGDQISGDQITGDDFLHKRDAVTGQVLGFRSDYYTGEAILGLILSGCRDARLVQVTQALMARHYGWAEQSHWMAYAACAALEAGLVPMPTVRAYLEGLAASILLNPAYRDRGQSTPIACRAEALSRLLLADVARPGLLAPGFGKAVVAHLRADLQRLHGWYRAGQFRKGDASDRVQIDYIQHNATAFLNWHVLPGWAMLRCN